jgi:hypothetical protein
MILKAGAVTIGLKYILYQGTGASHVPVRTGGGFDARGECSAGT